MNRSSLHQRAREAGICYQWRDTQGVSRMLADDTVQALLHALSQPPADAPAAFAIVPAGQALPADAATAALYDQQTQREYPLARDTHGRWLAPARPGYYLHRRSGRHDRVLAVAPPRCMGVDDLAEAGDMRRWGVAAQVYGLRRFGDGGLGDSLAVAELGRKIADAGGSAVGLSPLHAAGPMDVHFSPYSPSHRGWLDTLQIAPSQWVGDEAFRMALERSGQSDAWARAERRAWVDWREQDGMRRAVWRALAEHWPRSPSMQRSLQQFARDGGRSLRLHAIFAVRQRLAREQGQSTDWRRWGSAWADADGPEVARFAASHPQAVEQEIFAQWLAASCWASTREQLDAHGQDIGLIWDLATGFAPGGSEAWQNRSLLMEGVRIGAPPDDFNREGQDWGLAAFSPNALRHGGYRPIRELLARSMARGGGLRIDHILGWSRLWFVPEGRPAREGGYVRYPLDDLLALLALESWRHRCLVIGEDLGTVPGDLRKILAAHGVMGIDVLQFTRDPRGRFLDPSRWRSNAVAMSSTHDLPPLQGWRAGSDIDAMARAQHWNEDARAAARTRRMGDIAQLDRMLERFPARTPRQAALHAVAESPSPLALFPLEDVLGERRQPNLPGSTGQQHPNWRRRLNWHRPTLQSALRLIARCRKVQVHA